MQDAKYLLLQIDTSEVVRLLIVVAEKSQATQTITGDLEDPSHLQQVGYIFFLYSISFGGYYPNLKSSNEI